jgi:hypothetical protein
MVNNSDTRDEVIERSIRNWQSTRQILGDFLEPPKNIFIRKNAKETYTYPDIMV